MFLSFEQLTFVSILRFSLIAVSPAMFLALFTHCRFLVYFAFSFVVAINHRSDFPAHFTRHCFNFTSISCSDLQYYAICGLVVIGSLDFSRSFHCLPLLVYFKL